VGRADRAEFSAFALARSGALHRAAYLMVGDAQLAQDLVQEALTRTYVAWPRLRDPRNAEAYCRKAITTTAISWFRRKGWRNEQPTETLPEGAGQRIAGHDASIVEQDALWRVLQTLPPRQRAALVLRYYEDLTEVQTAEAMGCAVGTVKSQVSAALAKLREALGDDVELLSADEEAMTR
jgi:RNA polymerase sigma-70 factor (sigma-E family)